MGAIRAGIEFISGSFTLAAAFIFSQPMTDFLFAIGTAMGGNAASVVQQQQTSLIIMPYVLGFVLILASIFEAFRKEDITQFRR